MIVFIVISVTVKKAKKLDSSQNKVAQVIDKSIVTKRLDKKQSEKASIDGEMHFKNRFWDLVHYQ